MWFSSIHFPLKYFHPGIKPETRCSETPLLHWPALHIFVIFLLLSHMNNLNGFPPPAMFLYSCSMHRWVIKLISKRIRHWKCQREHIRCEPKQPLEVQVATDFQKSCIRIVLLSCRRKTSETLHLHQSLWFHPVPMRQPCQIIPSGSDLFLPGWQC